LLGLVYGVLTPLSTIFQRVSSFKIVSGDAVHQPTWPLLLKIEHMVTLQVFGNNSKTVNNIKNLTWTQFWKGAIQGSFHKNLVAIGPVVSEEKLFFFKFHPPFFLICFW
jgi:hypothetical protein